MEITIQRPCDKIDWTAMSDFQKGKFCLICSKSVTDFTLMTDEEIIFYLNNSDESICARLNKSQMNRILVIENSNKIKHWTKIVAMFALITMPALTKANNIENNPFKTELITKLSPDIRKNIDIQTTPIDSIPKTIKGRVIEDGWDEPVKTSVIVKGTSIKVKTDSLGNFEIKIPSNYKEKEVILIVKSTGLEDDTEYILYISELPKHDIVITKASMMIGEIVVVKRKRWWQFWKRK